MESKKYTLLIDQDDVLAEYIQGVVETYNEKYHAHMTAEDCICWNLHEVFGPEIETIMHEPDLFRRLKPVKNALEVFERLYRSDLFELYIVTAANPNCVPAKIDWIKKYLPFFPTEQVIFCQRKNMIKGDFLLDDGMHNVESFLKAGGKPIIFTRPHNKLCGEGIPRVKNWLEFEALINNLCRQEENEDSIKEEVI